MSIQSIQQAGVQVLEPVLQQGQFQQQSVTLLGQHSNSQINALEELTQSLSEKASKDFTKLKAKDLRQSQQQRIDKINQIFEKIFNTEQSASLDELASQLMSRQGNAVELLKLLQSYSDDPAEQFVALQELRQRLIALGAKAFQLHQVDQALSNLKTLHGDKLQSDLNILEPSIAAHNEGLETGQALRGFYFDAVKDYQGITTAFQDILENYGNKHIDSAIGFMLQALAADFRAKSSSIDREQLQVIMQDMQQLKALAAIYHQCQAICDSQLLQALSSVVLMESVIALFQHSHLDATDVDAQFADLRLSQLATIRLYTELHVVLNNIPVQQETMREQQLVCVNAVKTALDQEILKEQQVE